jgi:hypothetical protein
MNATTIKLLIGVVLFATWVALVVCNVPNSADLITKIQVALLGLGFYHLNDAASARGASVRTVYSGEAMLGTAAQPPVSLPGPEAAAQTVAPQSAPLAPASDQPANQAVPQ